MTTHSLNLYDIVAIDLYGKPVAFRDFVGKPLMIVNTASLCGYSAQLPGIEAIHRRSHHEQGLTVIGIPTNDFGKQEPGNNPEIASICSSKFGVTFPYLEKTTTKGPERHPIFTWLAEEGGFFSKPRWNFYKYVIDRRGNLVGWFGPSTSASSAKLLNALSVATAPVA